MKTKNLLLLGFLICSISYAQIEQEKFHRAKIYYNSLDVFNQLIERGLPMDHGNQKRGVYIESDFSESQLQAAKDVGAKVEILIDDVKAFYVNQNNPNHRSYVPQETRNATCPVGGGGPVTYDTPVNYNGGSMGGYLTYQEFLDELDQMASLYPSLITAKANISTYLTEGQTDNSTTPSIGGNGIKWVKISDNPNNNSEGEPQILYTALHHAREATTLSQLVFYMWYLLENYSSDPEIQYLVDNTELYFVPVVNPDGYLYNEKTNPNGGGMWRKNRKNGYGIDNNRNYNYHINGNPSTGSWGGAGSSGTTSAETYRGTAPFSEIENQAIKWFVEQHNFVIALNNHSSGGLLYHPFAYANLATPEETLFQQISSEMVSQNGFTALRDSPFAGESDDFMYGTVGTHSKIYAMTTEIGPSFWPASNQIIGINQSMMYLNLTAANMVGNYATIEDTSPLLLGSTATSADYKIKRLGIASGNFTVSVNPVSSNIVSVGPATPHNGLALMQEQTGNISINLDAGITDGENIVYELIINNGLFDRKYTITKVFGTEYAVFEEFGDDTTTYWNPNSWGVSTSEYTSPGSSITESPSGNYGNNLNSTIQLTNEIDLATATSASLSYNAKWNIENNYDYMQLQISTNSGASWIPQCGKYTNTGVANQAGANNEPVYDDVQNTWVLEEIDLSDYLGSSILIRFQFISDTSVSADGFYFDDLTVKVLDPSLGTPDYIAQNFSVYPNPVENTLNINSQLSNYDYKLYTIQGQLISEKMNNSNVVTVDCSALASGMYLLDIQQNDLSKTYKFIKK